MTTSVGAAMRAQSAAASIVAIIRARQAIRASDSGARTSVLSCRPAKRKRAERSGNAAASLAAKPPGRLGEKQRAEEKRQARVDLVPRAQMPARPRRRRENERARPVGMRGGETKRDQAAERDAAHDRPIDPALIERGAHLLHIAVEAAARVEREARRTARRRAET